MTPTRGLSTTLHTACWQALALTTADGSKKVYSGSHELVFSRGNGEDIKVAVTV